MRLAGNSECQKNTKTRDAKGAMHRVLAGIAHFKVRRRQSSRVGQRHFFCPAQRPDLKDEAHQDLDLIGAGDGCAKRVLSPSSVTDRWLKLQDLHRNLSTQSGGESVG